MTLFPRLAPRERPDDCLPVVGWLIVLYVVMALPAAWIGYAVGGTIDAAGITGAIGAMGAYGTAVRLTTRPRPSEVRLFAEWMIVLQLFLVPAAMMLGLEVGGVRGEFIGVAAGITAAGLGAHRLSRRAGPQVVLDLIHWTMAFGGPLGLGAMGVGYALRGGTGRRGRGPGGPAGGLGHGGSQGAAVEATPPARAVMRATHASRPHPGRWPGRRLRGSGGDPRERGHAEARWSLR